MFSDFGYWEGDEYVVIQEGYLTTVSIGYRIYSAVVRYYVTISE